MSFVIRDIHSQHNHSDRHDTRGTDPHPRTFFRVIFASWLVIAVIGMMAVTGFPVRSITRLLPCQIMSNCKAIASAPESKEASSVYLASIISARSDAELSEELTRGQMAIYLKDMLLARDLISQKYVLETLEMDLVDFTDIPRLHPAYPSARVLTRLGILKGKKIVEQPGVFLQPDVTIRRGEMAALLVRGLQLPIKIESSAPHFSDVSPEQWFYRYVETLYSQGGLPEGTKFQPGNLATEGFLKRVVENL